MQSNDEKAAEKAARMAAALRETYEETGVLLAARPDGLALLVALVGIAGFAAHLAWQLRRFDMDDPRGCLRLFRSNRDAGLLMALGLAVAGLV